MKALTIKELKDYLNEIEDDSKPVWVLFQDEAVKVQDAYLDDDGHLIIEVM